MTSQSTTLKEKKSQTVSKPDMTLESAITNRTEQELSKRIPVLLQNMSSVNKKPNMKEIKTAATLCARDYKGPNNYGTNGVLEWKTTE